MGLLDGTDAALPKLLAQEKDDADKTAPPNPAYTSWLARYQIMLSYLLNSFSPEIVQHLLRIEHTADVWEAVETMFASESRCKVTNLRTALANTKKFP